MLEALKQDIGDFLNKQRDLFFNEEDFQVHLTVYLRQTGHYDYVDLEYFIHRNDLLIDPTETIEDVYPWENEIYIDIVVKRGTEFVAIELKYTTRSVSRRLKRFDEEVADGVQVIKNHGAQNIRRYNFWKDVRRVELVKRRFKNVVAGLCVYLTNDNSYLKPVRENSFCYQFSMSEGVHDRSRCWNGQTLLAERNPDFYLSNEYNIEWKEVVIDGEAFNYVILEV